MPELKGSVVASGANLYGGSATKKTLSAVIRSGGGSAGSVVVIRGEGENSALVVNESNPNTASGVAAFAAGNQTTASGNGATAVGDKSIASGSCSFAGGEKSSSVDYPSTASGNYSFAYGLSAKAEGASSVAFGQRPTASALGSAAIGNNVSATGRASMVVGQFNVADDNAEDSSHGTGARKYLFIVGNGTANDARSNALTVDWDGNLEIAGDIKSGGGLIPNAYGTKSASGSIVSFSDGADGVNVEDMRVSFDPVRNLNGYSEPWPEGGGKNLLKMTVENLKALNTASGATWSGNTYTRSDVSFEVLTDAGGNVEGIKVNGTASDAFAFVLGEYDLAAGTYVCSGLPADTTTATYYMDWRNDSGSQLAVTTVAGSTYTSAGQTGKTSKFYVASGVQVNNITIKPMIRLSSADSTFAPYANISPITGFTGVSVTRTGKNLYHAADADLSTTTPTVSVVNGEISLNGTPTSRFDYSPYHGSTGIMGNISLPAGTYTVSVSGLVSGMEYIIGSNGSEAGYYSFSKDGFRTITLTKYGTLGYDVLRVSANTTVNTVVRIQIERGSVVSSFEHSQCDVYPISFGSGAGTVYGGTLDVTTGELIVDRAFVSATWGDLTKTTVGATEKASISLSAQADGTTAVRNLSISNITKFVNGTSDTVHYQIGQSGNAVMFYLPVGTSSSQVVQLCYYLATPTTYHISPVNVKTLLGYNNIWNDIGGSEVQYYVGFSGFVDELVDDIAGSYITKSASGAIASFTDGANNIPVKDLTININPVQSGSGDPSPENVRPITGWTGANVYALGGINCSDITWIDGYYYRSSGSLSVSENTMYEEEYIPVIPGASYSIYFDKPSGNANHLRIHEYNSSKVWLREKVDTAGSVFGWIASEDAAYIRISLPNTGTNIRIGEDRHFAVSWQTDFGTVYGGMLDVTAGVITVTKASVDLGTLNWTYSTTESHERMYSSGISWLVNPPASQSTEANIICSQYDTGTANETYLHSRNAIIAIGATDGYVYIYDENMGTDADAFKTAMSGVQLVYELVTPVAYQIAPVEVKTLLGGNYIWADTGNSTVEYRVDSNMALGEAKETFWATYNVTTAAEIRVAYDAGKEICVRYGSGNQSREYKLAYVTTNSALYKSGAFGFVSFSGGTEYGLNCRDSTVGVTTWSTNVQSYAPNYNYILEPEYTDQTYGFPLGSMLVWEYNPDSMWGEWKTKLPNEEVTVATDGDVSQALDPMKMYHFTGSLTSLTITFTAPQNGEKSHYHFDFVSGATAATLTMPNTATMPDGFAVQANKRYEVDVLNGYGMVTSWTLST